MGVSRLLQRRPPGDHQLRAPDGTIGTAYSHTVTSGPSEGPPATFALTAGALPSGLTLNPTTGAITGTPTTVGLFTGEITAANGLFAPDDTQAFSIEIAKATTSLSGTASGGGPLGTGLYDEADLSGGSSPTGTITIELYGPGDSTCSNPPVYTESKTVVGNGGYESHTHTPTAPGVYRWVASYSGDGDNAASATACGAPGQSATIDAPLDVSASGSGTGYVDSSPAGIDCGTGSHTTCSKSFGYGSSVTLTAHPGTGSDFTGWSGGGCSGTSACVVTMDQVRSVSAVFTLQSKALDVTTSGTGTGTVTSAPAGIDCGSASHTDCSKSYDYGSEVTLTATADASSASSFNGWGGACSGTASTCTVTMDQARSVSATFTDGAPQITSLSVTPRSFSPSGKPTSLERRKGSTVEITLSEPALVNFRVKNAKPGKAGGPPPPASKPRSFKRQLPAGSSTVAFSGKLAERTFKPRRYRLVARAIDSANQKSEKVSAKFRVVG